MVMNCIVHAPFERRQPYAPGAHGAALGDDGYARRHLWTISEWKGACSMYATDLGGLKRSCGNGVAVASRPLDSWICVVQVGEREEG